MNDQQGNETIESKDLNNARANYNFFRLFENMQLDHKCILEIGCGT
ncbi:MAG: hypothetical protein ACOCUV_00985 [bacterium]